MIDIEQLESATKLRDAAGNVRMMVIEAPEGPVVLVLDANGEPRAIATINSADEALITFSDTARDPQACVSFPPIGEPSLLALAPNGQPTRCVNLEELLGSPAIMRASIPGIN